MKRRPTDSIADQDIEDAAHREDDARSEVEIDASIGPCSTTAPCAYRRDGGVCTFCYVLARLTGSDPPFPYQEPDNGLGSTTTRWPEPEPAPDPVEVRE